MFRLEPPCRLSGRDTLELDGSPSGCGERQGLRTGGMCVRHLRVFHYLQSSMCLRARRHRPSIRLSCSGWRPSVGDPDGVFTLVRRPSPPPLRFEWNADEAEGVNDGDVGGRRRAAAELSSNRTNPHLKILVF